MKQNNNVKLLFYLQMEKPKTVNKGKIINCILWCTLIWDENKNVVL